MFERLIAFFTTLLTIVSPTFNVSLERQVVFPEASLETIFQENHGWTATISAQNKFTLIATGDVLTARTINKKSRDISNYDWMWSSTAALLKSADLTFINLETPLVDNCPITTEGTVFCGSPSHTSGLLSSGIDVVNLANNHIGNYGEAGISSTVAYLETAGIKSVGIDQPTTFLVNGLKITFLGFNDIYPESPGGYWAHSEIVKSQIEQAKRNSDLVIVQFHWGNEYTINISSRQLELGRLAVDSGADLVVGNHPHWVQPIEIYKNKLITYAHGNFIFDQSWSDKTRHGVVGKYTFVGKKLVDAEFVPVYMQLDGSPVFATDKKKIEIISGLKTESYKLQNRLPTQVTSGNTKLSE